MLKYLFLGSYGAILIMANGVAHAASCNESLRLDAYLHEWLSSSSDELARARQYYKDWMSNDRGYEAFVGAYKRFYGQRSAPLAEIGYCNSVQLGARANYALSRFP
jgi:hypothetical protein